MATGFSGLIDGALLGQLKFEWRLNPYAFYTTGGKISCVKDNWSNISVATDLLKRDYTIKSVRMIFDTYHPAYTPKEALGPTEFWSNAWLLSFEKILANSKLL